jgi:hypothetical protein
MANANETSSGMSAYLGEVAKELGKTPGAITFIDFGQSAEQIVAELAALPKWSDEAVAKYFGGADAGKRLLFPHSQSELAAFAMSAIEGGQPPETVKLVLTWFISEIVETAVAAAKASA